MSSARFETELEVHDGLRRVVLLSGAFLMLAGVAILLHLGLPVYLRLPALLGWCWHSVRELARQARAAGRVRRLRVCADGSIVAHGRGGSARPVTVLSGSLVGERLAWLRLGFDDGTHYGELLAGDPRDDRAWHRLQLIWQQQSSAFGRVA